MKQNNIIMCCLMKDNKIILTKFLTIYEANKMTDFITNIYTNHTGGITIILKVELK
jgi:hypothetical protein